MRKDDIMSDLVIVGIELSESEDNALRVEAAKAGLSKRKFARQIVVNWLEDNHIKNVREVYNDILHGIISRTEEGSDERNELLDSLLAVSDGCGELVKLIIKAESTGIKHDKSEIISKIDFNRNRINDFCGLHSITPLPYKPIEILAFELVDEYRPGKK